MAELSDQQQRVVDHGENVFVTACPGSGKTRVLAEKVVSELKKLESRRHRIVAVTFTNRAADEIASRLHDAGEQRSQVWTGTIHAFALEWILRPYSGYVGCLRNGFAVADEHCARKVLDGLREKYGLGRFDELSTAISRDGSLIAAAGTTRQIVAEYREELQRQRLIDFDMVLFLAYDVLRQRAEIPKTLASMMRLICVDEYQDTQDLQYGILSAIVRASSGSTNVFIVGDTNQAIYSSLGGVAKTVTQIAEEFGLATLKHFELSGNYRSTQRIIDFCSHFQDDDATVKSLARYANERGAITFSNRAVHKDVLAEAIAGLVMQHLDSGVSDHDICILAPTWRLVIDLGRSLLAHLPNVDLDAPGLSPLRYQHDSVWFKLARLFLTDPDPARYRTRLRWAADFVHTLEQELGQELDERVRLPRNILRCANAIKSVHVDGLPFLQDVFAQFISALEIDMECCPLLRQSLEQFFTTAKSRFEDSEYDIPVDVDNLKKMFRHPAGVVINTCHGVKGEEYTVVIGFGVLRGYIPNWRRIMDSEIDDREEARRLLYVVSSRSRKCLHLFSEDGRETRTGKPYEPTRELREVEFTYD